MIYRLAADSVLLLHLAFITFALFGALLALRWRWIVFIHLPAAIWGFVIELTGWICPLTYAETSLRMRAGDSGYTSGFIDHWLVAIIYPAGLTPEFRFVLAGVVVVVNVAIYAWLYRHRP